MPGAFGLKTSQDFLGKLERELGKLRDSPNNQDHAFNFFVTAEQMLDWLYPGKAGKATREVLRNSEPLLQVVSHLASSSKHFDGLSEHHQSVEESGVFFDAFFGGGFFGGGFFDGGELRIVFKGNAVVIFGQSKPVLDVAEMVCAFWKTRC